MTTEQPQNYLPAKAGLSQGTVVEGAVRVGPLFGIPHLLQKKGLNAARVMAEVGVDPSLFDDPNNTIPFATMGQLFRACAEQAGCAHFGLLTGQMAGADTLGAVGLLAQHAPDVGAALRDIILYLHLHDRGAVPTLAVADNLAILGYAIYQRGVVATDQIYDGAIAIGFNIMRELCGPTWLPTEVLFSHAKPLDTEPFRQFFRARLRFDAEATALHFPASWLRQPLRGANPQLRRILEAEIERLEARAGSDLPGQLRRVLRNLLVSGRGSMDQVAQLFAIHRRTLNRRLTAQRISFKQLVDEVRFEIAHQLLRDTNMLLVEIASILDYADAASFTRAFRRWSGTTPGAWREALRSNARLTD